MSRTGDAVRTLLRGLGQTLITVGLVVLLFCVYELSFTNVVAARAQDRLDEQLERSWASEPVLPPPDPSQAPTASAAPSQRPAATPSPRPSALAPLPGSAFARLHAPSLRGYAAKNVVEGVTVEDLKLGGPGHIPDTALPGELGNVVLSGHRTTYGAPFNRWDELDPGEQVVLETRDRWFTYTVTGSRIVAPTAVEVTFAVPGDPTATPTRRLLTMTTCHPEFSAKQRLIVSAELTATEAKADGPPAALRGT